MIKMIFLNPKKETEGERCGCSFCRKGQRGCRMRKWFFQILYSPEWVLLCPVPSIRPGITKQGAFNVGNWFCPKATEAEDGRKGFEYFINRCRGKMQSEDYLIEWNAANCAERAANSQIEEERRGCSRGFPGYRLFWATVACCHSVPILNKRPTRKVIERYQHSSAIEAGSQP